MNEPFCCCPGCGECKASANEAALKAKLQKYRTALQAIATIKDKMFGGDWDEIEEARKIANRALK